MKLFAQTAIMAALAFSSIAAPTMAVPTAANAAVAAPAPPRFYRETVFYGVGYNPGTSPFPGNPPEGPTPGGTYTRPMVGWIRYYCDGTVRVYGEETGDYEDYYFGECS